MTVELDPMMAVGPLRIAILCDRKITVNYCKGTIFGVGQKRPVAVLIAQGMEMSASGPDGTPMTRSDIEQLCPGAWRTALEAR